MPDGRPFGNVRLSKLGWQEIEHLYAGMRTSGRGNDWIRRCATVLARALELARKRGLLDSNPSKDATRPKTTRTKPYSPTLGDVRHLLLDVAEVDPELADAAMILASTGMRRGELLGLQWKDVDLTTGEIHVAAAITDGGPGVGLVRIRRRGQQLAFAAPDLRRAEPDGDLLASVIQALGLQGRQVRAAQLLDNGPVWLGLMLDSPDTVLALDPDHARLKDLGQKVGVASVKRSQDAIQLIARYSREARAFAGHDVPAGPEPDLVVRAFAAPIGVNEDPVTGSLNASLAQWLMGKGLLPARYQAFQGRALGRDGRVQLARDAQGQVWVGGQCVGCIAGEVRL